jgi:membrane protease YdiL (CAAX protease family)
MMPSATAAHRFCARCGSSLASGSDSCPTCSIPAHFCARCGAPSGNDAAACPCESRALPAELTRPHRHLAPVRQALTLYFVILAALFIAAPIAPAGRTPAQSEVYAHLTNSALIAGIAFIASLINIRQLKSVLARTGHWTWYAAAPFIAVGTCALATGLLYLVGRIMPLQEENYSNAFLDAGYPWWLPFIVTAVQPAIFEELAFRGVITGRLRCTLESRETLIVTALLFATLHLSPISFVHLFVMGLVLGFVRERTRSLYPGMLIHFCHNGYIVLAELLLGGPP